VVDSHDHDLAWIAAPQTIGVHPASADTDAAPTAVRPLRAPTTTQSAAAKKADHKARNPQGQEVGARQLHQKAPQASHKHKKHHTAQEASPQAQEARERIRNSALLAQSTARSKLDARHKSLGKP